MRQTAKKIGLISDTHGFLRVEAMRALEGSDLIVHAGDVGNPEIIDALKSLAPVKAIRGNIDTQPWASALPATAVVEAGHVLIYVLHDLHQLDLDPRAAGFHIVIFGHTHKPASEEKSGVRYLNPGSAGPRRFQLPVSIARLDIGQTPWKIEIVNLLDSAV